MGVPGSDSCKGETVYAVVIVFASKCFGANNSREHSVFLVQTFAVKANKEIECFNSCRSMVLLPPYVSDWAQEPV